MAASVPDDHRSVDAQGIDVPVPHAGGGAEAVREQKRHARRLRVVHLEGQRDPVWALQSVHWITSDPDWMAGYRASGPRATRARAEPVRPAMMPSGFVSPGPESTGQIMQRVLLRHADSAVRLMGGRRHQLRGPVGKHFGASDFKATPAELDRFDRAVDSRCDHGGLLVDGDQMGLNCLETPDRGARIARVRGYSAVSSPRRHWPAPAIDAARPSAVRSPERLFGDLVRRVGACGHRHTVENRGVAG